jgi:hypothetical protein
LRGLEDFQAKHPDVVVLALDAGADSEATKKILSRYKLGTLRVAPALDWQWKLGVSDAIPCTVIVSDGEVRVVHQSVLPDPVTYLDADLAAIQSFAKQQEAK